jgi:transposase
MELNVLTVQDIQPLVNKVDELLSLLKAKPYKGDGIGMVYSNKQLAQRLNVSIKTLQNYRDNRLIEFNQVGRKISYTEDQVQRFLSRHRVKTSYLNEGKGGRCE